MNYRRLYQFVYARYGYHKWQRMSIEDALTAFARKHNNYDIYTTVQRFRTRVPEDNEEQWCPLFFDFDAPKGCKDAAILDEVKQDALKIVNYFLTLGVPKHLIKIYFSGQKGFHVIIEPEIFGIEPHKELTYIIRQAAFSLYEFLNLKWLDKSIYTIKRTWRIPNSVNAATNLFKVELFKEEVESKSIEEIREIAKKPRSELWEAIDFEAITPDYRDWWNQFLQEFDSLKELEKLKPRKVITVTKGEHPKCVRDLLSQSIKVQGTRNRAVMILAGFLKDAGYTESESIEILIDFSKKIPSELSVSSIQEREVNCKAVVKTVYADENYHFSCAFIRSIGTIDRPISCDFDICTYVKAEDQEPIEPIPVELVESSKSSFIGLPMKIKCMVSGKDTTPYQVPRHIKITCNPDMSERKNNMCEVCKIKSKDGTSIIKVSANDPVLLDMIEISRQYLDSVVMKIAKIPGKCSRFKTEVLDYGNLVDVQLIPRIKFSSETITKKTEYAVRRGLFVGHDIETSEEFEFVAYSYPDPKTQHGLLLITDKKKMDSSDIELSKYDPKVLLEELQIFQVSKDKDIVKKLSEKWDDLEANVTKIYGRKSFDIALDLVYHSAVAFTFNDELITKGWLELLAIGDSGQGKTQCVQRLIEHYQAGTLVSGETSKRTGLIYNIQQTGERWFLQWGVIPLNDLRLVVIDEFHELEEEDIKNMTSLRDGVARVDRVVKARTPARTRLIFLCNPIGVPLTKWSYKVNAVQRLFKNQEDLRRIDFAVGLTSGEVDVINLVKAKKEVPHRYTSNLCNTLIRWVWSLQPKNIHVSEEATKYILDIVGEFSDMFTPSVQLTETGDLRKKIAKLAVATACMVFSTNDGINLNVEKEHAQFAVAFLKRLYQKLDYEAYTNVEKRQRLSPERMKTARGDIVKIMEGYDLDTFKSTVEFLLNSKPFFKSELEIVCGSPTLSKDLLKCFYKHHLIELAGHNKINRTQSLNDLIKALDIELREGLSEQSFKFERPEDEL